MKLRKRKLNSEEILNLGNSDSEPNESEQNSRTPMTLNSYFGVRENPQSVQLLIFPSYEFFKDMKQYQELLTAKRVRFIY